MDYVRTLSKPLQAITQRSGRSRSGALMILRPGRNTCRITLVDFRDGTPTVLHDQWLSENEISPMSRLPLSDQLHSVSEKRISRRLKTLVLLSRNECCFARNVIQSVRSEDLHETAMLQAECSFPEAIHDLVIDYVSVRGAEKDRMLLMTAGKDRSTIESMGTQLVACGFNEFQILPESAVACLSLRETGTEQELVLTVVLRPQGRLEVLAHHRGVLVSHQGRHLSESQDSQLRTRQIFGEIVRSLGVLESIISELFIPSVRLLPGDYDHQALLQMLRERHSTLRAETGEPRVDGFPGWFLDDPFENLVVYGSSDFLGPSGTLSHNLAKPRQQLSRAERRRRMATRGGLIAVLAMIAMFWWTRAESRALQDELTRLQQQMDELQGNLDQQTSILSVHQAVSEWKANHSLPQDLMAVIHACLPDHPICRIRRLRVTRTDMAESPADIELDGSANTTDTVVMLSEALLKTGRFRLHPFQVDRNVAVSDLPVEFSFHLTSLPSESVASSTVISERDLSPGDASIDEGGKETETEEVQE